jgi:polar amino acid transport system substrate-binding protein
MGHRAGVWAIAFGECLGSLRPASAAELRVDMIQFTPWAQRNPDPNAAAPYTGIVVDFLDEFERRSGHTTRRVLTPYARVELDLENGGVDFSIMAWGDARARYANKGTCLVPLDFGVRARKGVSVQSYQDLYKIITSASRGLKIDPRFDQDPGARKDMVVDYTTGVRKTAAARDSDAVAGSLSTINYLIASLGLEESFGDTLVLNTTHLAVAYAKRSAQPELEAEVNAVFKAMVADGTAKRIYGKWLGQHLAGLKGEGRLPNCAHETGPASPQSPAVR